MLFFFLTCRVLLCLFGWKWHIQVWLIASTLSVSSFVLIWGMHSALVSRHAQAPYEHRCAFMLLTLNLAWNVSQVSDLGLITVLWRLMCGPCCRCGAMCMYFMWIKTLALVCTLCVFWLQLHSIDIPLQEIWASQIPHEEEEKRKTPPLSQRLWFLLVQPISGSANT